MGKRFEETEHVTVPAWMTFIPDHAFHGTELRGLSRANYALKTVSLPNTITKIDQAAFFYCESLTEICIPESVTSIGSFAFCGCSSLKKVSLPAGIKEIGKDAFSGCTELVDIEIPVGVSIEGQAFEGCKALADSDGFIIKNGILFDSLIIKKSVKIPESVKHIGDCAFWRGRNYGQKFFYSMEELIIPEGVISIGMSSFQNCKLLRSVAFPIGLKSINERAFCSCTELRNIWIPDSLDYIADNAFQGCPKLKIYGIPGSTAEQFAKKQGFRFYPLDLDSFIAKVEKSTAN